MLKLVLTLALVAGVLFQLSTAETWAQESDEDSDLDSDDDDDLEFCEPEPPQCNKPNEIYDPCDNPCPARRCDFDPTVVRCKAPPQVGDKECLVGCRCMDGFLRNDQGICVKKEQCPKKCPANEVYVACPDCNPQTCSTVGKIFHCPLIPSDPNDPRCKGACRCKPGFARDNNGDCVPTEYCSKCKGTNEVYDTCPGCSPQTCATRDKVFFCPLLKCKPACRCKRGFFRNVNGECVSAETCAKCDGPNEYFACGSACDNRCDSKYGQDNCNIINVKCNDKCYCAKNYARATNGTCIPKKDCQYECPVNERYDECPEANCGPKKCTDVGFPLNCPTRNEGDPCPGKPGCVCNDGYLRNKAGVCVPSQECPSCGGDKNATLGCGVNCGRTCSTYQRNDTACILICYLNSCDCREGYVFDEKTKKCVLPEDCSTKTCPDNEMFVQCPETTCRPLTCSQAGFPVACPIFGPEGQCPGKPRCICKGGYLRNEKGVCIPQKQCPSCGGDGNAIPGCGVNCGRHCSNYNSTGRKFCPLICNLNGCDCKPNYVYDDNRRRCVLPEKCTRTCPINEVFTECENDVCRRESCESKGIQGKCNVISKVACKPGCICAPNYLRQKNGTCIPKDQCDEPYTCPEGEIYEKCPPPKCAGEFCPKTRNDPQTCPYPDNDSTKCSKPRCVCGFNRHRDWKTGKCIETSQCPPFKCDGPNESFDNCVPVCPGETCEDYINNSTCPKYRIGIVVPCKLGCRCDKGYYRDSRNICIPGPQCTCNDGPSPTTVPGTTTEVTTTDTCDAASSEQAQQTLEQGNLILTGKAFYELVKSNPGKSVFSSIFSLLTPLSILLLFSSGKTYDQLASAINVNHTSDIRCGFPGLLNSISDPKDVILDLAARIYVYKQGDLSKTLKDDSALFRADAESINFLDAQNAANIINKWVSDATRDKIKELVDASMFDATTRIVLANAIYFKGNWKYKFNANKTVNRPFHVTSEKTVQLPTMTQKGSFKYGELSDPAVQVLEIPYVNENISLLVILPTQTDGLLTVVEKMRDPAVIQKIMNSVSKQQVTIFLPKSKIESKIDLKDLLKSIGVTDVFDEAKSKLSGMTNPNESLYVSDAIQKTFIEVNEEGAEAAAANAVVVSTRALPRPPPIEFVFNADHPYIFMIKQNNLILFQGAVVN